MAKAPANLILSLGVVEGRNVWKNDYAKSLAKLEKAVESTLGMRSYIRAVLSEDAKSVMPLADQEELSTLSDANAFIAVGEKEISLLAGDEVTVVILERRYI